MPFSESILEGNYAVLSGLQFYYTFVTQAFGAGLSYFGPTGLFKLNPNFAKLLERRVVLLREYLVARLPDCSLFSAVQYILNSCNQ